MSVHQSTVSFQTDYTASEVSRDSDELVLELLKQCELKLLGLLEEVKGHDLAAIMKEIEDDEVS